MATKERQMNKSAQKPRSRRQVTCRVSFVPPKPVTLADLAKLSSRSRRGDDANNPHWKFDYEKHRERINTTQAKIDTSAPMVVRNLYSSPAAFNRSITNFVKIERENAMMLHRIATIMKGPPTIENKLHIKYHSINVRSKAREMQLLRIAFDNLEMWKRIQSVSPKYSRKEQLEDYEKAEKVMGFLSYYPLYWKIPANNGYEFMREQALVNAKRCPRPQVFLDLETDKAKLGKVVIELRADIVPMTAENFRCLCTGEMGISYKCSQIHRVIPGILWQGGEVTGGDGRGGKSIFGETFPDENFKLKHKEVGTVSMANMGKDTNGSQFIITAAPKLGALDGVNVVVGKVTAGLKVLEKLSEKYLTISGQLKKKIWIAKCGSMDGEEYEEEADEEEEDEGEEETDDPPTTAQYEGGAEDE